MRLILFGFWIGSTLGWALVLIDAVARPEFASCVDFADGLGAGPVLFVLILMAVFATPPLLAFFLGVRVTKRLEA